MVLLCVAFHRAAERTRHGPSPPPRREGSRWLSSSLQLQHGRQRWKLADLHSYHRVVMGRRVCVCVYCQLQHTRLFLFLEKAKPRMRANIYGKQLCAAVIFWVFASSRLNAHPAPYCRPCIFWLLLFISFSLFKWLTQSAWWLHWLNECGCLWYHD